MVHKILNTSELAKYQITVNDSIFSPSIPFMNHTIHKHVHIYRYIYTCKFQYKALIKYVVIMKSPYAKQTYVNFKILVYVAISSSKVGCLGILRPQKIGHPLAVPNFNSAYLGLEE